MKNEKERLVGHIEKRGKDSYRLTVSAGFAPNGKRIRKRRTVQAMMTLPQRRSWQSSSQKLRTVPHLDPSKTILQGLRQQVVGRIRRTKPCT